jgi:hypothetical protein
MPRGTEGSRLAASGNSDRVTRTFAALFDSLSSPTEGVRCLVVFGPKIYYYRVCVSVKANSGTSIDPGLLLESARALSYVYFGASRLPTGPRVGDWWRGIRGRGARSCSLIFLWPLASRIHPSLPFLLPLFPAASRWCSRVAATPRRPDFSSTPTN